MIVSPHVYYALLYALSIVTATYPVRQIWAVKKVYYVSDQLYLFLLVGDLYNIAVYTAASLVPRLVG